MVVSHLNKDEYEEEEGEGNLRHALLQIINKKAGLRSTQIAHPVVI